MNNPGSMPRAAMPFATPLVFSTPSSVKYLSGSGGHFGSSRSIAMPCRTTWSSIFFSYTFSTLPGDRLPVSRGRRRAEKPPDSIHDARSRARINLNVALFLKPLRAAARVAEVFAGIAAGLHFQSDGAALKRGVNFHDTLPVRVIETLGDA